MVCEKNNFSMSLGPYGDPKSSLGGHYVFFEGQSKTGSELTSCTGLQDYSGYFVSDPHHCNKDLIMLSVFISVIFGPFLYGLH